MANRDRIADVYYGRAQSAESQEACRERVHWMCRQVVGHRVLDIGCSQGVTAIILAREGRQVLGLDIEEAPIADARRALAEEPPAVRQRVEFRVADAFSVELDAHAFDTVLLGEVLEHLTDPTRVLERICAWLVPEGRLVVTVPLGYHPFHDHKRTLYLFGLLELLGRRFEVLDVDVIHDRYLCAVARPARDVPPPVPSLEQLCQWARRCETALEHLQRRAHAEQARLRAAREQATVNARKQQQALAETIARLRRRLARRIRMVRGLREELAASRREVEILRETLGGQIDRLLTRETELRERIESLERVELKLRTQIREQRRQSAARIDNLREQLERQRREIQTARQRVSHLREQIQHLRETLRLRDEEVRYQLGDALVRCFDSPLELLRLPLRLVRLFGRGLARRRARRRLANEARPPSSGPSASKPGRSAPAGQSAPQAPLPAKPAPPPRAAPRAEDDPRYAPAPAEQLFRRDLVIAAVMDEFSFKSWQFEAQLYSFTPGTWREALEARPPALLLVESTWKGPHNAWHFHVRDLGKRPDKVGRYVLPEVVEWCRDRGIPTIFYNKEDPPNFEHFIDAAGLFDYVFTSDENCIAAYRERLGHERVWAVPFAAQPRVHHPMLEDDQGHTRPVGFAGTWYNHRHLQRQQEAERILAPALEFGLEIYDRMADSGLPAYRWPEIYQPAVRGAVPYTQMLRLYKRYKVFLNINTVADSPTMFARRVFELLACGTPVISSYALGIERLLGSDVVLMSRDPDTTRELLHRLLSDDAYRERLALQGQRRVFADHTYGHRLCFMLERIGLTATLPRPSLCMLAVADNPDQLASACENYRRQRYPRRSLLLGVTRSELLERAAGILGDDPHAHAEQVGPDGPAAWLSRAAQHCPADYVVALRPGDYYGPWYLTDYAHATLYAPPGPIGKGTWYECDADSNLRVADAGRDYRPASRLNPWTLCAATASVRPLAARLRADTPTAWWAALAEALGPGYSSDRFNYVALRGPLNAASEQAPPRPVPTAELEAVAV